MTRIPSPRELATHFAEGQLPEPAFRYARRAGDLARGQYANVDAAALYRRAIGARPARPRHCRPPTVADVAESLGDVAELAGRYDEALACLRPGAQLHRSGRCESSPGTDPYADEDWAHQDGDAGFPSHGWRARAAS